MLTWFHLSSYKKKKRYRGEVSIYATTATTTTLSELNFITPSLSSAAAPRFIDLELIWCLIALMLNSCNGSAMRNNRKNLQSFSAWGSFTNVTHVWPLSWIHLNTWREDEKHNARSRIYIFYSEAYRHLWTIPVEEKKKIFFILTNAVFVDFFWVL